ncbi:mandelate racemase/muconate lactonizing enzyme family protein [Afifella sp. YEN Y35]|uniref:mandelate racemase/muconate lactonizing enzyme family protein n=1 Tax=Afifella sp. YEN Y35 TaxID=3388337 RepID=UPI0039E16F88
MKITSATVYHVKGQGLTPVIVELQTDAGITGLGEAAPSFGCGGSGAAGMIRDLCERFVVSRDARRINAIVAEMIDQAFWLRNPGGIAASALSAIETALWDIKARSLDLPVYDLFGGRLRDNLDYYANGWYFGAKSRAEVISKAEAAVRDGHRGLKMYPLARIRPNGTLRHPDNRFADDRTVVKDAIAFVRDMRAAIGPDVLLMLDLAGGLSHSDTILFCKGIEEYDISFVEEIIDPGDLGAMRQIAPHIQIPIATGERHHLINGFRDLLETRSVGILQPDIGNVGGFAEAFKVAALGEAYGLKVQPHVCASSLGASVGAHLSACIRNFYIQEHFPYWSTIPGYVEVANEPFETCARNGVLPVPEGPGFGVTLNKVVMEKHVVAHLD